MPFKTFLLSIKVLFTLKTLIALQSQINKKANPTTAIRNNKSSTKMKTTAISATTTTTSTKEATLTITIATIAPTVTALTTQQQYCDYI